MMPARLGGLAPTIPDNPLGLSWHDSAWIPILNPSNVMDYFSERSNPFFDRTCNNEIVKMQRLNPDQLQNMTGLEYVLLHVQEPILYVIRKQHRHSPTQTTPQADYYIIAGVVYQAPDLASVLNSRLLSAVHHLQSSFEEASSFSRYHPSKGYTWDFKAQQRQTAATEKSSTPGGGKRDGIEGKIREEPSSLFQRQRVDMLLGEMVKKFPLPSPILAQPQPKSTQNSSADVKPTNLTTTLAPTTSTVASTTAIGTNTITTPAIATAVVEKQEPQDNGQINPELKEIKTEIKQEKNVKPPEKKPRLN